MMRGSLSHAGRTIPIMVGLCSFAGFLSFGGVGTLRADPGVVIASSGLNVRGRPEANAPILITATPLSIIEIIETTTVKETVQGKPGVWLKVRALEPSTGNEIEGYAFDAWVFHQQAKDGTQLLESYLAQKHRIVIERSAKDDLHWTVSVRLKAGRMATVFSNAGSQDVGESDFYLADVHPGASWLIFRRRSYPEAYLVDYMSGHSFLMEYASPVLSPDGQSVYDVTSGGMFGSHLVIYDLKSRSASQVFRIDENDLPSWDRFRCAWKDSATLECSFMFGNDTRRLTVRRTNGQWRR